MLYKDKEEGWGRVKKEEKERRNLFFLLDEKLERIRMCSFVKRRKKKEREIVGSGGGIGYGGWDI